jgi:hypothetical protein
MKAFLLASALLMGGAAYAQTVQPEDSGKPIGSGATLQQGTTMGERDTMGANMPAAPTTSTTTTTTTDTGTGTSTMTTGDSTMSTTGSTMGTTGSGTVVVQQGGNMSPPPTPRDSYPRCSRTITDNCVQDERRARDTRRSRR